MFFLCSSTPPIRLVMRFGTDLTEKALFALEEVVQECRYRQPHRSFAIRFALAYLWTISRADRRPIDALWKVLGAEKSPWSYSVADRALRDVYRAVGLARSEAIARHFWRACQERQRHGRSKE
jgi:hypothetical protein